MLYNKRIDIKITTVMIVKIFNAVRIINIRYVAILCVFILFRCDQPSRLFHKTRNLLLMYYVPFLPKYVIDELTHTDFIYI